MKRLYFAMAFLILIPICGVGQITSNAFYSENTSYADGDNDPVFFYTDMAGARLTAAGGEGNTYNWYSYNAASGAFDVLAQSGGSVLAAVAENGYRVEVNDGNGGLSNYYCWNFVPVCSVDSVGVPFQDCSSIRVTAYADTRELAYYDHKGDGSALWVDYGYQWTSTPAGPMDDITSNTALITAPGEDTEYQVVLGGKFAGGMVPATASRFQIGTGLEAKFSFEVQNTSDNEAKEGSAPMIVRFTDESIGKITDWEWTFGDAGKAYEQNPIFTFQEANEYPVVLLVRGDDSDCESESPVELFVVKDLVVKVPSAFTPFSSPGQNDEFKVLYRSVKKYSIVVYNRWGRKVYTSSDPAQGWNGRIGGRKAEPGVYFYTIEAQGYKENEKLSLEGAIHLIVNK